MEYRDAKGPDSRPGLTRSDSSVRVQHRRMAENQEMHLISRRTLVAGSLAIRATTNAFAQSQLGSTNSKFKIVVTGGHPGDPEYGCGGTIARYTDLGHEVVLLLSEPRRKRLPRKNSE